MEHASAFCQTLGPILEEKLKKKKRHHYLSNNKCLRLLSIRMVVFDFCFGFIRLRDFKKTLSF